MKKYLLFSILVGLCIAPLLVSAQAFLVKDIFPGSNSGGVSIITNVNGTLFFNADDGIHGRELWKSDGTEAGTILVKDIWPGGGSSEPRALINVNGTLFFTADDGIHGNELWKSDGTAEGTVLIKDIIPPGFGNHDFLTNVNGTLFFRGNDGIHGDELWKSDGTTEGTVLVKDIRPSGGFTDLHDLTSVNSTLFFTANDGIHGQELWKSDGTEAGTILVKDIRPGGNFSDPILLTNVNGTLFFNANDGIHGDELWKSDGTEAGTILVKDIFPVRPSSSPFDLANVNGMLFFRTNSGPNEYQLWKSDGTEAGTVFVKLIPHLSNFIRNLEFTNVNGTLFFVAGGDTQGYELWKSDGTSEGTMMVKDIWLMEKSSNPNLLTNVNGTLFFIADDGLHGRELWKSDGTEAGTFMVADINPAKANSNPIDVEVIGQTLYFWANDGVNGHELWKFEGEGDPPKVTVQSFTLVNADTDTDILELTEGMQLNLNELPNARLNIRANTNPPTVGSVFLQLSRAVNANQKENTVPYALFGDDRGNYRGQTLGVGNYTIRATPFSMARLKGEQGRSLGLNFSITEQAVESFTLVNADIDTDILELTEGMQLNLNELPNAKLNIRANTNPPTVGSVMLQLSGAATTSQKENSIPYALFGDNNGNYNGQNLGVGEYTITATPYTKINLRGGQGRSLSLNFSIIDNFNARIASEGDAKKGDDIGGERLLLLPQKSWVYPNPFTHTFTVELSEFSGESVEVHLFDLYGKPLMVKNISPTSGTVEVDVESANMGAGTYLLKLIWGERVEVIKLIREN